MENEILTPDTNEIATAYIVSSDKKIPGRIFALVSMIMAITSATFAIIVGFVTFAIIVLTFLSYSILLPLLIPVLCFVSLLLAIAAIVLSRIAKSKGNNTKSVKVGFILGIISAVYWTIVNILMAAIIIVAIVALVLIVVIAIIFSVLVSGATAVLSVLGPLVTILTPIIAIFAGVITGIGGEAVSETIAYLYEFLWELFNLYIINGAALVSLII